jgi:hypothetical protein
MPVLRPLKEMKFHHIKYLKEIINKLFSMHRNALMKVYSYLVQQYEYLMIVIDQYKHHDQQPY